MLYPIELRAQICTDLFTRNIDRLHRIPAYGRMVGEEGFEPTTSSSQSWRSTRLSYTPVCRLSEGAHRAAKQKRNGKRRTGAASIVARGRLFTVALLQHC